MNKKTEFKSSSNSSSNSPLNSSYNFEKYTENYIYKKIDKYNKNIIYIYYNFYNENKNYDWFYKLLEKFKLNSKISKKNFNIHLILLLTILYILSYIKYDIKNKFEDIKYITNFLEFLYYIVFYLEQEAITGIYNYSTKYEKIYDINNLNYFKIAKIYLKKINKETGIYVKDFNDEKKRKHNVYYISNTNISILLNLILKNIKK
jgi:hypothetical protein